MPKKEKLPKQAKHEKQQKKRKGRSVQDFIGVKTFTKYGLMTQKGELLFYLVSPTNISVLSYVNIEIKIRHLMMVLSSIPDIEITCTDSSECFDDNKAYGKQAIANKLNEESVPRRHGTKLWYAFGIDYMLNNERYMGDALLQKKYTTDTLPFKKVKNRGERPKYYVENANPAIVSRETYSAVQELQKSRQKNVGGKKTSYANSNPSDAT